MADGITPPAFLTEEDTGVMVQKNTILSVILSRLIAVYSGTQGGTKETIEYAKTKDVDIVMYDDDPDSRWDAHFGEPSTKEFTVDEFLKWFDDVMKFE